MARKMTVPYNPPAFAVTVDLVVLTLMQQELCVLVIQRKEAPYRGRIALPGVFVRGTETLEGAVRRTLKEEGGLAPQELHFEQLASFGHPKRDPRGRVLSVGYLAIAADLPSPDDARTREKARWLSLHDCEKRSWAFDHAEILRTGVERARAKLEYSTLATSFCAREFTLSELRGVYEAMWNQSLDPGNFRRKVTNSPGFVEATGERRDSGTGRPAQIYRAGEALLLYPAIHRDTQSE